MPWAAGQSVTTGSIATSLGHLFVFGPTDSGKNLVTGTTLSTSLFGSAAYGTDAIGTYVGNSGSAGRLVISTTSGSAWPDAAFSYFVTFSREAALANWAGLFLWGTNAGAKQVAIQREDANANTRFFYNNSFSLASGLDLASISLSTEYTLVVVMSGSTQKVFYKGGTSPVSLVGATTPVDTIGNLEIGGWGGGEWFAGRTRAFGRWSRALSDAEAQSMADNPQQIITPAVTYTYARPTSDITTQWTPSTGTDHYALIDETVASDADYIYATAAGQTDEVKLALMTAPQAGTDLKVNYRVQGIVGSASVTLSLVCNATVIATDTARTGNGDYTLTVASGTWASVSDWTNMRLRFVSA